MPEPALVLLMGISGSGKSSFATRHFRSTEIISSDRCRALIADDETDQSVSKAAFELLRFIAAKRLDVGKLTVIDATNVLAWGRQPLLGLAREREIPAIAIVLDLPLELCHQRNQTRTRAVPYAVVEKQAAELQTSLDALTDEGFAAIYRMCTPPEIDTFQIARGS